MSEKKNTPPTANNNGKQPPANPPSSSPSTAQASGQGSGDKHAPKSEINKPSAAQNVKPDSVNNKGDMSKKNDSAPAAGKAENDKATPSATKPVNTVPEKSSTVASAAKPATATPEKSSSGAQGQNQPQNKAANLSQPAQASKAQTPSNADSGKGAGQPPRPPVVQEKKRGNGLSLIALAVSVIALGWGVYQSSQNGALRNNVSDLQSKLSALENDKATNASAIESLRSELNNINIPAAGMDRDSVVKTIAENIATHSAELEKSIADSTASVQSEINERIAALPKALSRSDVQSLIKQELATFSQNLDGNLPGIDFSDEIAKVEASENNARNILAQIEQSSAALDDRLQQALTEAEKRLTEIADSRASVLNLVSLAQLAGYAGEYQGAAQYLQQANSHLSGSDDAKWQGTLADAAQRYQQLASQPSATAALENLIARVEEWPLRGGDAGNIIAPAAEENAPQAQQSQSIMDKVKQAGQAVLASTVTVVPLDDGGLSWINHNPALQNIIRENVRLDLAFARNALQMQDSAAYTQIITPLKASIERYFDTDNNEVKAALDTLNNMDQAAQALPDLAPVIQALRTEQ